MVKKMNLDIKFIPTAKGKTVNKPFYATEGSAGMDLSACIDEPVLLKKGEIVFIPTGIAISLPNEKYGAFLFARSGLASKHGITLANCVGVVDSDYTGEIKVGLINLSNEEYIVTNGERIAQMVIMPVAQANLTVVDELEETERGSGGFGSTGAY